MKIWEQPKIISLGLKETYGNGNGNGNGDGGYFDPSKIPEQHPDWIWCNKHVRWHPKDHFNNHS